MALEYIAEVNDELVDELKDEHDVDVTDEVTTDDEVVDETPQLPEKFANKSREEIAQSYIELEKTLGKQAQEIGEHRKIIDSYLRQELDKASSKTTKEDNQPELTFDDLVDNPEDAIGRAVSSKLSSVEEKLETINREAALGKFKEKHPDYLGLVESREFLDWVGSSSYRTRQFQAADQYDFEAADELFSTYKEITSARKAQAQEAVEKQKKQELKEVAGESGSTGERTRKVYNRRELIKLRMNDPEKFDSMYDEIARAYQEGRVKG